MYYQEEVNNLILESKLLYNSPTLTLFSLNLFCCFVCLQLIEKNSYPMILNGFKIAKYRKKNDKILIYYPHMLSWTLSKSAVAIHLDIVSSDLRSCVLQCNRPKTNSCYELSDPTSMSRYTQSPDSRMNGARFFFLFYAFPL